MLDEANVSVAESTVIERDLDKDARVERTGPSAERRETLAELVRRPEAEQVYDASIEDGSVREFTNRKGLFGTHR